VLLLSVFFLMVLFFLAVAFLQLLPLEMNAANRQKMDLQAYFVADAGIITTLSWMEAELEAGREPVRGGDEVVRTGTEGDWKWSVVVRPDDQTPPLGNNPVRVYKLTATASIYDRPYRRVTALAGQESFAKYALFIGTADPNLVWDVRDSMDGPFHINDVLRLWIPSGYWASNGEPSFLGQVSSDQFYTPPGKPRGWGDGVRYSGPGGTPYDESGNPVEERYRRMLRGGSAALTTGASTKEMPANSATLAAAAWGDESTRPSAPGVYLNATSTGTTYDKAAGGIYVAGDVDSMELGVASGNSTIKIVQGGRETRVTVVTESPLTVPAGSPINGQPAPKDVVVGPGHTVLKYPDGSFKVVEGTTNGVVYVTGNVNGLHGTNKGRRTVAVDTANDKDIVIDGDLYRADTPAGQAPGGSDDSLGLVAYDVRLSRSIPRSLSDPLYLYCAIFAGRQGAEGGFQVDGWNERPGQKGRFELYGSLVEGKDHPWGTIGFIETGFSYAFHYDSHLADNPPPYFPMLPRFHLRSWSEESAVN
jgi:hypothetical protein